MAEYIESKCRDCFNLAPCATWIKHGTMLYSDFSYSVEGCQYFVSAADVAPVVHGRWVQVVCHEEFEDGFVDRLYECCSRCHEPNGRKTSNYCPNCGADMRGE